MNSENNKTSESRNLVLKLTVKLDLGRGKKSVTLSNLSIYYTWKNIKSFCNNSKPEISVPTWNDKFELSDGSYSVTHIQDYFEYILKEHGKNINNPSVRIHVNEIKNKIVFKIKTGYYLELLTPETMKLLGCAENKLTKNKNGENVQHLEITEEVLLHFNIANNDYHQDSRVFYIFVPNTPFGSLLEISPKDHIFLKTFTSEFQSIEVWVTDQNS